MRWYNQRWYDYTGLQPEQIRDESRLQVYAPDALPAMRARWQESVQSGRAFEMEYPIRSKDGQYRWFLTRANAVRDSSGRVQRWFGTSTDVDQVKRVQEQLREETNVLDLLNRTGNALPRHREKVADIVPGQRGRRRRALRRFVHSACEGMGNRRRLCLALG